MKILKTIGLVLLGLVLLLAVIGLFLPSAVHVERSVAVAAPPQAVFDIVNGFKRYQEWSPWIKYDPAARYTTSGPEQGVGARFEWASDKPEVGSGSQEITASVPGQRVDIALDFGGERAIAQFVIAPEGAGSKVTWGLDSKFGYNLLGRYIGLMFEGMVGPDYEQGLQNLKKLAEADAMQPAVAAALQISVVEVPAVDIVTLEGVTATEPQAVSQALRVAYDKANAFIKANGLEAAGQPFAITRFYDESGWGFDAGLPVAGSEAAKAKARSAKGEVKLTQSYAGQAVKGVHIGSYADLPETYRQLEDYMAANKLEPNGRPWEQYISDPVSTPEAQLQTDVYMPAKATP